MNIEQVARFLLSALASQILMTRNKMRVAIESGKGMKVKVVNCVETSEMDLF